jgi:hypothetical protein
MSCCCLHERGVSCAGRYISKVVVSFLRYVYDSEVVCGRYAIEMLTVAMSQS